MICGRSPLRTWKVMLCFGPEPCPGELQPQGELRCSASFLGRSQCRRKIAAVIATIDKAVNCCQSMNANYCVTPEVQPEN
jgi:hypothetical protein